MNIPEREKRWANELPPGELLEPYEFLVTPELNQQYLFAAEDYHPRYWENTESGPPIVHPGLLLNLSNHSRSPSYHLPPGVGGVQATDEAEFLSPGRVGKKFRVTFRIAEKYEKRGLNYHIIEAVVVDEDGVTIMRKRGHIAYLAGKR